MKLRWSSAIFLQLCPIWPDTANTSELGLAIHSVNRELRKIPLVMLVLGLRYGRREAGDSQTRISISVTTDTG